MNTTEEKTFRAIYKCRNKDCKHIWALDYRQDGVDRHGPYGSRLLKDGEQMTESDKCEGGRRTFLSDVMGYLRCPSCNYNLPRGGIVAGVYKADHKCSAKCRGAKGQECECECGGKNHGIAHLS